MAHRIIKVPSLPVKSFLAYSSAVVFGAFASIAAARTETGAVVLGLVAVVAEIRQEAIAKANVAVYGR